MVVIIPVRFKEEDLRKIDKLVKVGMFKSRSEAIRRLSLEAVEKRIADFTTPDVSEAVEAILKELKKNRRSLKIISEKTAAKIVAEGREFENLC